MSEGRALVIGAGAAGLAAAGELKRRGVPVVVVERGDGVGTAWRSRYDRLRLNSSRWFSQLPGARFEDPTGPFPARDEMVRYLERYAERRALDVRLRVAAERIDRDGDGWVVRTSAGDMAAAHVVVATGYAHDGRIPAWPGRERFAGALLHAADYRNPAPFRDLDVLVVGAGCSGMEIAYDLALGGAARVRLAVRTPPNILVRTPAGPALARAMAKLPPARADAIANRVRLHELGDLEPYGLPLPDEGVFSRLRRLRVAPAIVDREWIDVIRDGRVSVVAGVEALDEGGVRLADGVRIEPDAVVAATGYTCALESLVGHLDVLDGRGVPRVHCGEAVAPGLRFVGYLPRPAQLGYFGGEAKAAARGIASELAPSVAARRRWPLVRTPARAAA
jgi:cation diffusion facilitator CzcD-associated flavoprotein CzcO